MQSTKDTYLNFLGIKEESPSEKYLSVLINRHFNRVPYETFSKFYYYNKYKEAYLPSLMEFTENLANFGFGGTCYTITINFGRLLLLLGFNVKYVRVNPGHIGLIVIMDNKRYYVDVGYGAPIIYPIDLSKDKIHVNEYGENIYFEKQDNGEVSIDRRHLGKSFVTKSIMPDYLNVSDFDADLETSCSDINENNTMRRITAVIITGEFLYFLRNNILMLKNNSSIKEYTFGSKSDWKDAVKNVFGIKYDFSIEALVFLKKRKVDIFKC